MGISPNRLVTILTPLVFAPLAGAISVFAADHIPGLEIDSGQLQSVFIAGALIAFGKAGLWLKGWQNWESAQNAVPNVPDEEDVDDDPTLADEDPDMDLDDEDPDADDDDDDEWQPSGNGVAAVGTE